MRKQGLVFLAVVAALFVLINSVITDRWIERRLERFGTRLNGAAVELDLFDFSITGLRIDWARLQVTDPEDTRTNLFETGRCSFDLAPGPLLKGRFIVEEFELQGLRFGTERATDGAIRGGRTGRSMGESPIVRAVEQNIREELGRYPLLNLERYDVQGVWDAAALESPRKIESLKERLLTRYEEWEFEMQSLPGEAEAELIRRDIDAIVTDGIDTPQEAVSAYERLEALQDGARAYQDTLRQWERDFETQLADVADVQADIEGWVDDDLQRLSDMAGLPELSRESVARMLFGERFAGRMERVLTVLGRARTYSQKVGRYVPVKELPPRGAGQDIRFIGEQELPRFWIQRMRLSGESRRGIAVAGSLEDVVSDQVSIDRPTTLQVRGVRPDGDHAGLWLSGVIDGRGDLPRETFDLELRDLPLAGLTLSDFPLLPYTLSRGTATVNGRIDFQGQDFLAQVRLSASGMMFDTGQRPDGLSDELHTLSLAMARSIGELNLTASVVQEGDQFSMNIRSSIDGMMLDGLRQVLSDTLRDARAELEGRIESEIGGAAQEVELLVAGRQSSLESRLREKNRLITEQLDRIERLRAEIDERVDAAEEQLRREAEQKLSDEVEEQEVEEKARDLLDSLFQ
jgi:uncharacterized protein (TIGR03545 family)